MGWDQFFYRMGLSSRSQTQELVTWHRFFSLLFSWHKIQWEGNVCVCLSVSVVWDITRMKTRSQIHTPIMKWQASDRDISFKRTWSKPPTPSKDDCKPAHMQNGPGKILATTLTTYPAKHYRNGRRRRRRQQMVEISQYLYCEQNTMMTLTLFKRHLPVSEEAPCSQGMRNLACVRWT